VTGLGTLINAVLILLGGVIGLRSSALAERHQLKIKGVLSLLTIWVAASMMWRGLNGTLGQVAAQFGIALLALVLGNVIGKLLRIQKGLNRLGQWAQGKLSTAGGDKQPWSEGFVTATLLFCVGPMAILGAIEDGMKGDYRLLAVKGLMDGLATMGLVAVFGRGVMLAVIPVVAYQGSVTILARWLGMELAASHADAMRVSGGLIVLMIPVVILGVRKAPLADYLPALAVAPLLTWWWR
jgi:uncharacterized protein